jgi:microcompartment protein CcmK/EutM
VFLGQVIGSVVAPVAIPILQGQTLLLVRPVTPDGQPAGRTRVAIDRAGAGVGERVLVLDEGNGARQIFGDPQGAVKTVVVGVVDFVETQAGRVYDAGSPSPR